MYAFGFQVIEVQETFRDTNIRVGDKPRCCLLTKCQEEGMT